MNFANKPVAQLSTRTFQSQHTARPPSARGERNVRHAKISITQYQKHGELDLVLTTDRNLVTDVISVQNLALGKTNHFFQEARLRQGSLIVRRQPRTRSKHVGAWVWRDGTLTSICLANMIDATTRYLAECPSHVHSYAPRHLEAAPYGPGYQVDLEIYIDGSFNRRDDLPAGWGFTVVSPPVTAKQLFWEAFWTSQ